MSGNRNNDKTVTNLDLTTKDSVNGDSFQEHINRFAFIVALSVSDCLSAKTDNTLSKFLSDYILGGAALPYSADSLEALSFGFLWLFSLILHWEHHCGV